MSLEDAAKKARKPDQPIYIPLLPATERKKRKRLLYGLTMLMRCGIAIFQPSRPA